MIYSNKTKTLIQTKLHALFK